MKFHLHKTILCHHSIYFRKALDGGFKEQTDKVVNLPEDDTEAFVLFVRWIYNLPPHKASTSATVAALFGLYILAEKFCMETLKNLSMDVVRASYSDGCRSRISEHIDLIYGNTPENSPMRRFITNYFAYSLLVRKVPISGRTLDMMRSGGDFVADFASATVNYSYGAAQPTDPSKERKCVYHEHTVTKHCPWTPVDLEMPQGDGRTTSVLDNGSMRTKSLFNAQNNHVS